jgi:predicted nucleic acid-binding Zn ribbon protein
MDGAGRALLRCGMSPLSRRVPWNRGRWQLQRERHHLADPQPPPPSREPLALADGIAKVLRACRPRGNALLETLAAEWIAIAGADLARHTRPAAMERDCLVVYVDSSVWLHELQRYGQKQLLENVRRREGGTAVRTLRLRLDPER